MKKQIEMNLNTIQEKLKDAGLTDEQIIKLLAPIRNEMDRRVCGLVWQNQASSIPEGFNDSLPYFEHLKDRDIIGNGENNNLLIEGDNLYALLGMQYTHIDPKTKKGMIDCIYIDPPYATGNVTFGYNDKFEKSEWLSMMDIRLKLAKNLLTDDGVIFISIDDNNLYELKLLCDEIFTPQNRIATICVELSRTQGMKVKAAQDGQIVKNHEYVLVYGKTSAALSKKRTPLYEAASSFDQHYSYVITEENEVYKKQLLLSYLKDEGCESYFDKHKLAMSIGNIEWMIDNDPDFKKFIIERASVIYCEMACNINVPDDIVNQLKTGKIVKYKDYLLHMTSGGTIRQYRSFEECLHMTDDYSPEYCRAIIRGALWKGFYSDMMNINKEGGVTFKNGKKPVRLIKQLFKWANSTNATILDFFAGSGTTGQAVLELNAEDGGNRHFILCTNNEIYDPALRKQVDKEIRDAGSVMTEQAAAKLYAEIGVCHHVTYPRMQNIFKDHPDDSLRYMKINTDVKETGSDEADVRSVIDEFVPYIEIRENAYDAEKHDSYYQLASSTKDVLVFSADSDRCLIPYLKAKRLAKQVFADDGKEHVVYCETGTEQDADGVHFVPYPAQVLNRIKAGKKFVRREEIA